jgi:alcohol dehydrogenase (cytochrome c)
MTIRKLLLLMSIAAAPVAMAAQSTGLDPAQILKPLSDSWPTYSGDYTGRRYSALKQINHQTVKGLSLAWVTRVTAGSGPDGRGTAAGGGGGFGGGRGGGGGGVPLTVGGEGTGELNTANASVRGAVLMVDGILYATSPDNAWAIDARDGRVLWQYYWKTRGGTHIGNRGFGMWHNYLFFETPDNYLVSLDAKTGKERWHVEIAKFEEQYFSTMAPMVIGDHVLAGTGNDLDAPGFLQSFDPETGKLQWKFYTVPMNPGDEGLNTWPSLDAARHGGAQVWIPGAYDPETKLYIFGTGNPTPAYTLAGRGKEEHVALFTCSLVAVNVETGKMAWYYQTSPRDMHDFDSAQTPILFDATIDGKPRKLVATAARNGYFFTLDRTNGKPIVTGKYGLAVNWAKPQLNKLGQPVLDPAKASSIPGSLVTTSTTNWPPPAYSPDTGYVYVPEGNTYSLSYLIDPDPRGSMGLGGREAATVGSAGNYLTAIDAKTAKVVWRHQLPGGGTGILATAGRLLFAGDGGGNIVAFDDATGKAMWGARLGQVSGAPETYMLDGRQYLLVAAGDTLYAFVMNL